LEEKKFEVVVLTLLICRATTMRLLATLIPTLLAVQLLLTALVSEAFESKHDGEEAFPVVVDPEYSSSTSNSQPQNKRDAVLIRENLLRGIVAPVCESHGDCYNCTKASGCHWCRDQQCYPYFSVHGCMSGLSCDDPDDDDDSDDDKKKKEKDACSEHATCSECGSTHTCHWCAHDDACHTIGSIYGCVRGVDCFSNDRCRRKVPEPLPAEQQTFTNMGVVPMVMLGLVGFVFLCCTTTCWCCACGAKGAYDELCAMAYSAAGRRGPLQTTTTTTNNDTTTPLEIHQNHYESQGTPNGDALLDPTSATASLITDDASGPANVVSVVADDQKKQEASTLVSEEGSPEVQDGISEDDSYFYQAMEQEEEQQGEITPLLPATRNLVSSTEESTNMDNHDARPKHATRMMRVCSCFYFITVGIIGGLLFLGVRFFPKIPDYSVCNDSVEWTNLIRSMATLNVEVDFEILMSIENANHLSVALDMGRGILKHDGNTVGHYFIPPVEAVAMSITDVMIIATVSPQRWEALALTKEYYADKLMLHVDADVSLRIPTMFNVSREVSLRDIPVKISREQERHLCACKKWDGNNTLLTDIKELLGPDNQGNDVLPLL
jgi:hypothetical protein